MKRYKFQRATFPYLGSKLQQSSTLASFINPKKYKVLVSPFAGGCSFELFAKRRLGMRIISNDWSLISFASQKALLENNHVKIELNDIYSVFSENKHEGFVKNIYSKFFTDEICDFLDTASENIRQIPKGTKKYLLSHLLVFFVIHLLPYGKMGCTTDIRNIREKGISESMDEAATSESRLRKFIKSTQHPLPLLKTLAGRVNAGIANNNQENLAYCEDVFSFLPKTQMFSDEAVLFADPPYFQSCSYNVYDSIGEILLGRKIGKNNSVFNSREVEMWFDKFFEESQHLGLWLITYGGKIDNPNAFRAERFLKMIKRHRPKAKLLKFENFSWSINTFSGKSPKECEEYLVIAER